MDPTISPISPEVKAELCSRHGVSQLQARAGCQKTKSSLRIERSIFFLTSPFIEHFQLARLIGKNVVRLRPTSIQSQKKLMRTYSVRTALVKFRRLSTSIPLLITIK